jgi:hypothetical protein
MIPLSRCIEVLKYTNKLSAEQTKSIIFYLQKLQSIGTDRNHKAYSGDTSIPLRSKFN